MEHEMKICDGILLQVIEDLMRVDAANMSRGWRIVKNRKRAKLLRKRGENILWSQLYDAYIWDFPNRIIKS